jgi:flagellar hook-basal body complex protein FliE
MAIPTITVTPGAAAQAYRSVDSGGIGVGSTGTGGADFGGVLSRALGGVIATGQSAEAQSMQAIAGGGNMTDLVTAVSKAELALQTTTAIRDRVVQAYQDIMRMPI